MGATCGEHFVAAVSRLESGTVSRLARLQDRLGLFPLVRRGVFAFDSVGRVAGGGEFRDVSEQVAVVPSVLHAEQRLLAGRRVGRHEDHPRIWPRPDLQAFRRRVSRDGHDAARADAVSVLQRLGQLDAAQQMASRGDRRRRHVRRAGAGLHRHLGLVVHAGWSDPQSLLEHDVRLVGQHRRVQRQPAVALRRLLHRLRPAGDSQSGSEIHLDPEPLRRLLVSGVGNAGRPVPAASASRVVCDLRRGVVRVSLAGGVVDFAVHERVFQTVSA